MKLNHDCIRDVLVALERNLTLDNFVNYEGFSKFEETKKYAEDDIIYTLVKLREAGFINSNDMNYDNRPHPIVQSISYEGHQFLDNIRDIKVWENVKGKAASVVSGVSIAVLGQLASAYIKGLLGLS